MCKVANDMWYAIGGRKQWAGTAMALKYRKISCLSPRKLINKYISNGVGPVADLDIILNLRRLFEIFNYPTTIKTSTELRVSGHDQPMQSQHGPADFSD